MRPAPEPPWAEGPCPDFRRDRLIHELRRRALAIPKRGLVRMERSGQPAPMPVNAARAPCPIRTDDLPLTRRLLWPAELRGRRHACLNDERRSGKQTEACLRSIIRLGSTPGRVARKRHHIGLTRPLYQTLMARRLFPRARRSWIMDRPAALLAYHFTRAARVRCASLAVAGRHG